MERETHTPTSNKHDVSHLISTELVKSHDESDPHGEKERNLSTVSEATLVQPVQDLEKFTSDQPTVAKPAPPSQTQQVLQLIAAFFPFMNSWGILNAFGVFQAYYAQQSPPLASESGIAWIGSVQAFLLALVGSLVGPAIDAGYMKHVIVLGTALSGVGMIALGSCTHYYQVMLVQGLMVGVGAGCLFLPTVSIVPPWFSPKSRTLALAIIATGSSVGGMLFPIMFQYIQRAAGFGWAARAIGLLVLGTNAFSIVCMKYREVPKQRRKLFQFSMFKEAPYVVLCISYWLGFFALYIPIFFLQHYASLDRNFSSSLIFWLIPILMAGSLPGRLVPALVACKIGNLNVIITMTAICAILAFGWIGVHSEGGIIFFALIYGFASGGFVSLSPPTIVSTAPNMQNLGTRMGMNVAFFSIGVLVGTPIAGAILTGTESFLGMQLLSGLVLAATMISLLVLRYLKVGFTVRVKI